MGPRRPAPLVVTAGVLCLVSLVLLGLGALTANYGTVALLMGLYPVVTALLGAFLLGERLSPIETTGAVLAPSAVKLLGVGSAA